MDEMIGKTISHYKILEKLGEGGMGVVYKAEDTKLKRIVALKFLPPDLTRDPDAKQRFIQEAQAASAIDHQNICNIHAVDESPDGQLFICMAAYEGETLRDRIGRGPVEPGDAAMIASQIARGLAKAHGEGIVHRDLKPANIFITDDGQVKILDFGLAKLAGEARLTKTGTTVGTVAYMSPEQASGGDVDQRTDIWSLGAILYEMLAGELPFQGDHEQAIIYSIINKNPRPVGEVRQGVPSELARVVERTMQKDPARRYASAADMDAGLSGAASAAVAAAVTAAAEPRSRPRVKSIFPYLVLLAAFAVILVVVTRHMKPKTRSHQTPTNRQVTFVGDIRTPRLSPDGNLVAYSRRNDEFSFGLWIKDRETGSSTNIYSAPLCLARRWSPDGSRLLFSALHGDTLGGMYTIPRNGGEPRLVFDSPWPFSAWSPDGSSIAFLVVGSSEIKIVDLSTGETKTLAIDIPEDEGVDSKIIGEAAELDWSMRNGLLLFQIDDTKHQTFYTIDPETGRQTLLLKTGYNPNALITTPRWSPVDDAVYFCRMKVKGQAIMDLMKQEIDPKAVEVVGDPVVVLSGLPMSELEFSISADGSTFLFERETKYSNLFFLTVKGEEGALEVEERQLTQGTTWKSRAQISPDGDRIVFGMSDGDHSNIYIMPLLDGALEGGTVQSPKQLTFLGATNDHPAWSPDGNEIAFYSTHGGAPRIWHVSNVGGQAEPFANTEFEPWVSDHLAWAPGGKIIYRSTGIRNFSIFDPASGTRSALVVDDSLGYIFEPLWSPDGSQIVFFWNRDSARPPSMGLWVKSVSDGSMRKLGDGAVSSLGWTADGKWIWVFKYRVSKGGGGPSNIFKINVSSGEREDWIEKPYKGFNTDQCTITPDGRKLVCSKPERHADAWIVENFDPEIE